MTDLALIREALLEVDIACFPDFTGAVSSVCDELERFRAERSYIIGHNDGWRDALRREVFDGTVDTDSPLEAAAREAGWALMELVDEIDFRQREQVSDIISRLGKALPGASDDASEIKQLEWRKGYCDERVTIEQASFGGLYQVRNLEGVIFLDWPDRAPSVVFESADAAKAAAQKDFEDRIRSATGHSGGDHD